MTPLSYMRQKDLFDPINQRYKIVVLGAGSLGSFISLNLAKLGFNDVSVYDYDKVENHNIPNQFYPISSIGEYKVEALKKVIFEFTGVDIKIFNEKIDDKKVFGLQMNTIYILTFDTLESRKIIYNLLKESCNIVIDARCGGEEFNIRVVNTLDDKETKDWEQSFNIIPTELPCGARSIIYTNLAVASEICNICKKINNAEEYPRRIIRHMRKYMFLGGQ